MAGIDISTLTLAIWAAGGQPPATDVELEALREMAGGALPGDYVAFLQTHGFAVWGEGTEARFVSDLGGGVISRLYSPDQVDRQLDVAPDGYLPIAGEYGGHDAILLELRPQLGQIWHLNDSDELAKVAASFTAFIEGLLPNLPERRVEKWRGTQELDAVTGFTIAAETRAAWAEYYTGSTPEPLNELETIESDLGRQLPEALRSFLTTYGYVSFFGDALTRFDLPDGAGQDYDFISVIYSTAVLPRALPIGAGAPLPFASTALKDGELLIGMGADDEGQIYWRASKAMTPIQIADDLRGFLASLYQERSLDE